MTFQQRLRAAQQGGNLTVADLARWFSRPHATVRCWVENGTGLGGAPLDRQRVLDGLARLERMIRRKQGFPIPAMSPRARIKHLMRLLR